MEPWSFAIEVGRQIDAAERLMRRMHARQIDAAERSKMTEDIGMLTLNDCPSECGSSTIGAVVFSCGLGDRLISTDC